MKHIPRIESITDVDGFHILCLFTTGEHRVLDFGKLFSKWALQPKDVEYPLLNIADFQKVTLQNGTLTWENVRVTITDETGTERTEAYQIDPLTLYRESETAVKILTA
jgi:hypothetical protein